MSPTVSGLAYIPFGVGNGIAIIMFFQYDKYLFRAQRLKREWAFKPEYRRLPLACVGGPLWAMSLFWIGWTARAEIHWIVPILSGVLMGVGFLLIFIVSPNSVFVLLLLPSLSSSCLPSPFPPSRSSRR